MEGGCLEGGERGRRKVVVDLPPHGADLTFQYERNGRFTFMHCWFLHYVLHSSKSVVDGSMSLVATISFFLPVIFVFVITRPAE